MSASWRTRRATVSRIPPKPLPPDLDLSALRAKIAELPELRMEKVESIRRALALDDYDEDAALDAVIGRLQDDMAALNDPTP